MELKNKPLVSVLVLFYNHEKFVYDCLNGLLKQDYENIEVLIHDDFSQDKTSNMIKTFIIENDLKRFKLFLSEKNLGIIGTLNKLIKHANGEYLCFNAGDDISEKDRISNCVKVSEHYKPSLVYHNMNIIHETSKEINSVFFNLKPKNLIELQKKVYKHNFKDIYTLTGSTAPGCSFFFPKSTLSPVNNILPETIWAEDDYIFFLSALQNGVIYIDNAYMMYRKHSSNVYSQIVKNESKTIDNILNTIKINNEKIKVIEKIDIDKGKKIIRALKANSTLLKIRLMILNGENSVYKRFIMILSALRHYYSFKVLCKSVGLIVLKSKKLAKGGY